MVAETRSASKRRREEEEREQSNSSKRGRSSTQSLAETATPRRDNADIMKILQVDIPEAMAEIDVLLSSAVCREERVGSESTVSNSGPVAKSRRPRQENPASTGLENALVDILGGPEVVTSHLANVHGQAEDPRLFQIPSNKRIQQLLEQLEPKLARIINLARDVRHWIKLSLPKMESGGNFGVAVQAVGGDIARRIKDENTIKLHSIPLYYSTRAELLKKMMENLRFTDSIMAVKKFDDEEFKKFKMFAAEIKNCYEELLHYFEENIKLIKKPRSSRGESSYFA